MSEQAKSGYFADSELLTSVSERPKQLKYCVNGEWLTSKTETYMDCYNPSTGEVIALAPQCTAEEVESAVAAAKAAYPGWSNTSVVRRVQVLFRLKTLLEKHLDELTEILAREMGKAWEEAKGDVLKVIEVVEFACGMPHLMKGESLMDCSTDYDTTMYHHSVGVFAGIAPWNFPAMIPQGWMAPICIAAGNCFVLKAASFVPQTSMRITELWYEAGLPKGVLNMVTTSRNEAEILLEHPDIAGVSFVGSTKVGQHIYSTAAANGKRVQALTEAKNHALVLKDCVLERTARGIVNAFCGCAGQRCMALPVICVEESIADSLVEYLVQFSSELKLGPAYEKDTGLGPLVNKGHMNYVSNWIQTGVDEGAKLVLDGRNPEVPGYESGFYIGPTIFDHVTEEMTVGRDEIFGPVICIKRIQNFEEGLQITNNSEFANGSAIYTQSGHYAREFSKRTHAGMVGVNVGIPVPLGIFGFTGQKKSFFGDLHTMGKDGVRFFTELKCVTSTWFTEEMASNKVNTWDGTIEIESDD